MAAGSKAVAVVPASHLQGPVHRDACGVVAAVLKAAQPLKQGVKDLLLGVGHLRGGPGGHGQSRLCRDARETARQFRANAGQLALQQCKSASYHNFSHLVEVVAEDTCSSGESGGRPVRVGSMNGMADAGNCNRG